MGSIRRAALACAMAGAFIAVPARAEAADACPSEGDEAVICIVNAARSSLGLRELKPHALLDRSADAYAERMARQGFFSHTDPEGHDAGDRILDAGYGWRRADRTWSAGEALGSATGVYGTPQAMVMAWLASPSHRRIVLGRSYKHVGVGIARESGSLLEDPAIVYVLHVGTRRF